VWPRARVCGDAVRQSRAAVSCGGVRRAAGGGGQRGRATLAFVWGMWRGRRAGWGRRAAGAWVGGEDVLRGACGGGERRERAAQACGRACSGCEQCGYAAIAY